MASRFVSHKDAISAKYYDPQYTWSCVVVGDKGKTLHVSTSWHHTLRDQMEEYAANALNGWYPDQDVARVDLRSLEDGKWRTYDTMNR